MQQRDEEELLVYESSVIYKSVPLPRLMVVYVLDHWARVSSEAGGNLAIFKYGCEKICRIKLAGLTVFDKYDDLLKGIRIIHDHLRSTFAC